MSGIRPSPSTGQTCSFPVFWGGAADAALRRGKYSKAYAKYNSERKEQSSKRLRRVHHLLKDRPRLYAFIYEQEIKKGRSEKSIYNRQSEKIQDKNQNNGKDCSKTQRHSFFPPLLVWTDDIIVFNCAHVPLTTEACQTVYSYMFAGTRPWPQV